jgi:hypothetical protein
MTGIDCWSGWAWEPYDYAPFSIMIMINVFTNVLQCLSCEILTFEYGVGDGQSELGGLAASSTVQISF